MKKLTLLTTAMIVAACGSANAVEAPSLGDRIKSNWDARADRNSWSDPYKAPTEAAPMVTDNGATNGAKAHKGMHHHGKKAEAAKTTDAKSAPKAKAAAKTPDDKAKLKAERKAKWDAMTPEQKAAWKAKHAAKKAAATSAPATK